MVFLSRQMKAIYLLFISSMLITTLSAAQLNLDKNALAIKGYDPVSYFSGQPTKGNKSINSTYNEATYYFTTEDNKNSFEADPETYVPAYGGWCAWAMIEGEKVSIDPLSYKIINGKNYLFYNGFWGNTLKKWDEEITNTPEAELVQQADQQWVDLH